MFITNMGVIDTSENAVLRSSQTALLLYGLRCDTPRQAVLLMAFTLRRGRVLITLDTVAIDTYGATPV